MKQILVLGAGRIARPLIRYLLGQRDVRMVIGTIDAGGAEALVGGHPHARVLRLDVSDEAALAPLVEECHLVISLLPAALNARVARVALDRGKSLINTSYVSPELAALHDEAERRGVLFLCEIGLDPGIDHMSAVRVIDLLLQAGGRVTEFTSCCGGFPAPDANTNPWGYKFSWSPRGVMLAGRNAARFLRRGEIIEIPGDQLFAHRWPYQVEGQGVFEMYPNRDSLIYVDAYSLTGITGMFRGTLRYPGWCDTMRVAATLGLFDLEAHPWPAGTTYAAFTSRRVPSGPGPLVHRLADFAGVAPDSEVIARLEWAGLLSDRPLPAAGQTAAPLDLFGDRLARLMVYKPGERDMVAMRHTFSATFPDGHREDVTSSLVAAGQPFGDTAMARTVSLPAAIAARLLLDGELQLTGVQIPVYAEIYEPVLAELEEQGVHIQETHAIHYPGPLSRA